MYGSYILNTVNGSATKTVGSSFGLYVDVPSFTSSTVTNAYGGYFNSPTSATNKTALYSDNMSIGYTAITPPASGLAVSGSIGIGLSSVNSLTKAQIVSSLAYSLYITGTQTGVDGNTTQNVVILGGSLNPTGSSGIVSTSCAGVTDVTAYTANSGATISNVVSFQSFPVLGSNAGTITNFYGFYFKGFVNTAGTLTNAYGGYFTAPGFGTNKTALYADNMSIGYTGSSLSSIPTNGLIVAGQVGIGTNSIQNGFTAQINQTSRLGILFSGGQSSTDGFNQSSIYVGNVFQPTVSTSNTQGIWVISAYNLPNSVVISNASQIHCSPGSVTLGTGASITNGYGILVDSITFGTTQYGGYFSNPIGGTYKTALYADNMSIGYEATTPPTSGLVVSGSVGIGTSGPSSTSSLQVSTSTSASSTFASILFAPSLTQTGNGQSTQMVQISGTQTVNGSGVNQLRIFKNHSVGNCNNLLQQCNWLSFSCRKCYWHCKQRLWNIL